MSILSPADGWEMQSCFRRAMSSTGPVYLRMGKADRGEVHTSMPRIDDCRPLRLRSGSGLALLATGSMVPTALAVADDPQWPEASVWSLPCIKPLHEHAIAEICRSHQCVVVLEEHSVLGGLGSAVAEIAASMAPAWVCRIGIADRFSEMCGSYSYLLREHGIDEPGVRRQIRAFLEQAGVALANGVDEPRLRAA